MANRDKAADQLNDFKKTQGVSLAERVIVYVLVKRNKTVKRRFVIFVKFADAVSDSV